VAALSPDDAEKLVGATEDGRIIGEVQDGDEAVSIRGLEVA